MTADPLLSLQQSSSLSEGLASKFETYRHQRLLKRVPTIGLAGLLIFGAFAALDYVILPEAAAVVTIAIRLFIVCPLIIFVIIAARLDWPIERYSLFYLSAYVISGLGVVAIIYTAYLHDYALPYDGILLHLVFGYFLMGMRSSHAIFGSLTISLVYCIAKYQLQTPIGELASNAFFIATLNFLGALGSTMQERSRHKLFLNELLVAEAQERDRNEIAAKTRLVATASHDLRQPLHAMNLLVESLESRLPEGKEHSLAVQLKESIRQLNQMLSSLLNISKLSAGIVDIRKTVTDASKILRMLISDQNIRAQQIGIDFSISGPEKVWVETDPVLLERVLRNIFENIFDHAQASTISVNWQLQERQQTQQQAQQLRIEICDNGCGMSVEQQSLIFEEFQRLEGRPGTGMGLGLAIVKQLCELLHIKFGVVSSVGQGACFWFELPVCEAPASIQIKKAANEATPPTQSRIAIIDDDPNILASTATLLEGWGYQVMAFDDPENALASLGESSVDLLICDYQFPQEPLQSTPAWNGISLIKAIRAQAAEALPAILVTADTQSDLPMAVRQSFDANAQAQTEIAFKPLLPAKLRLMLKHYLSREAS